MHTYGVIVIHFSHVDNVCLFLCYGHRQLLPSCVDFCVCKVLNTNHLMESERASLDQQWGLKGEQQKLNRK
jgi:hypothetical protein